MILERLYIENYKQLRDPVELYPPEGAIGVVGSNGTGKSTLFESILWAFFGSRGGGPRFANELIPWSGGSTKDPTVVEVTLALGGDSYTVRRQLKSGSTNAEARDGSGKMIVEGASDVTRWVEENLLGMDRTAFEATFFAKQKELKFFANDDGISRVRRISRMLGISGVEDAQKLLREDRNDLRSEARLLDAQLAEADLEALQTRLEERRRELQRIEGELQQVSEEHESAATELESAREARKALDAAYREHTRLTGELREAEGEQRRAADRAAEAEKDLAELAEAEKELKRLEPETARLPELEEELERLEQDRRKVEQRDQYRREKLESQRRIAGIESEVWDILENLDDDEGELLPGWDALFDLDGPELPEEAATVLKQASEELKGAETKLGELKELASLHEELRQAVEEVREAHDRHGEMQGEVERLSTELEDLSGGEDLEAREKELRREEEKLRELASNHRGRATADEREAKNVDKACEAIESGAEEHCPTCHRGFDAGEQEEITDTLRRQAAALRRRAARETEQATKFLASADNAAEKLQRVQEKLANWRGLRESLSTARNRAADRLETLEKTRERCRGLETRLEGKPSPTERDLEDLGARCDRLRRLRDTLPKAESLSSEHAKLAGRVEELAEELDQLESVTYDAGLHREKREEKARLERTQGRVEELKRRIKTRPEIERALTEARETGEKAEEKAGELRRGISALNFDEKEYEAAAERVATAEKRASDLRDAREHLGGAWKDADYEIQRVAAELKRLEDDRKLANEKASGAARMDEMDRLFTEFFRSLTSRVRPMLETEASNLVRDLTDGRYERMEFDENYRVKLLDRFDDSYAIERFSGGEADVASLSARVALSKIIAARGNETLGFLVLDEVFGSLDAERRNNVLLALERLKRSFGQIFIISHVGEVQESALVDEVWMLEEDEDGKSAVRVAEQGSVEPSDLAYVGE
ncbi:MAG: SMC family ATPase [Actinomycetota bacterium]|nr:SMC family ATPase [Actinomycetota bacterium]